MPNNRKVSSVGNDGETIENISDGNQDTRSEAEDVGHKQDVPDVKDDKNKMSEDETDAADDERDNDETEDGATVLSAPPAEELQEP